MNFRLELKVKPLARPIRIQDQLMLVGSCFTDHIAKRLQQHKFNVLENPHGILFNPVSIARALDACMEDKMLDDADLFNYNDLWASWDFHSHFSQPDAALSLRGMNSAISKGHHFLQNADWLILTLGSAFVYELNENFGGGKAGDTAANCHKVPAQYFNHRLLEYAEVEECLTGLLIRLRKFNPNLRVLFTISPVRHYREGLVENNRSKALLISAVHAITKHFDYAEYFPSYELIIDDLRDYRFFAEDLVHPNYQATLYVWEKFCEAAIDEADRELMAELWQIHLARNHRPLHPTSVKHEQFLDKMLRKTQELQELYPFLDLEEEIAFFARRYA